MGRQKVLTLRHAWTLLLALAICAIAKGTHAQDQDKDGVRRPERLTVGVADQFLGQLAANKKELYFASNRNTSNEIYAQDIDDGRSHLLFDEGAEVTWPRVSPDGKSLLYISYSDRATGQLCVRDLPKGEDRRCLDDPAASLLAEWIDSTRIILVARASIEANLRAVEVTVGSELSSRLLFDRNITSPAVSPDGKWLVYVPLERASNRIGPAFAAHAAQRLEMLRLDNPTTPVTLAVDVPGLSAQPTFSKDGKYLYFVQFFSDSNHDGVVDASDHGVLFRAPLTFGAGGNPRVGVADQITDESWNCQYPAPATDRLIMTCSHGKNLDLYSLPLDGEVPSDWNAERVALEVELASNRAKLQLLYYHRLARATTAQQRRFVLVRLVRLHLALDEFGAAEFYAHHIAALDDPEDAELSKPLLILIEHREALRARERGRIVEDFDLQARARLEKLPIVAGEDTSAAVLTRIVRSEIADTIGDKGLARKELESAPIAGKTPRAVLEAYYERADAFYREMDDRDALVAACTKLATHEALAVDDQLRYARAAVRAMIRGLPFADADAVLAKARDANPGDSEIGFAIDLGRDVLAIRDDKPAPTIREKLLELYEKQTRVDRRRAVMLDAVERANLVHADPVVEALSQHYVDDVDPGTQERRRAEHLYTNVMVGRAFRRRAAKKYSEALTDFEAVAKRTNSFEAVVGSIDLRLRAGEKSAAIDADYRSRHGRDAAALANFVSAYLIARELPTLEGPAHENAIKKGVSSLMASWTELKNECIAQALYGALLHEEFLRTGELDSAERASTHYLVALELVGDNLRYKAMVLGQLGLLHMQVGNYRIALGYLKDRDKLPFAENAEGFAVRLATARCLLHTGKEKDAATAADEALAMLTDAPRLAEYRILAIDHDALTNLAADRFTRALGLYDEELKLLDADHSQFAARNRFVVRLARAAAALGAGDAKRALVDLDVVDRGLADAPFAATLTWPHAQNEQVVDTYRLIASGLRAHASEKIGQLDAATRALEVRRAILEQGAKRADREEYVRALTLVEAQMAEDAIEHHDAGGASTAIESALVHADDLHARAKGTVDVDQIDVLWLAAELSALAHLKTTIDVPKRLDQADKEVIAQGSPALRSHQRWLEIYLTLTGPLAK